MKLSRKIAIGIFYSVSIVGALIALCQNRYYKGRADGQNELTMAVLNELKEQCEQNKESCEEES